ncbi:transposase (fragment) (plasmid) [Ralstonia solanacearum CMR15]
MPCGCRGSSVNPRRRNLASHRAAKRNVRNPYPYLKDVLTRLPAQKTADIAELLPDRRAASAIVT